MSIVSVEILLNNNNAMYIIAGIFMVSPFLLSLFNNVFTIACVGLCERACGCLSTWEVKDNFWGVSPLDHVGPGG